MSDAAMSPLAGWENFYVIMGSSAAALTGLQFVVMALLADRRSELKQREALDAFGTPTIVHFCMVLVISAILSAPWTSLVSVGYAIGASGAGGVGYVMIAALRGRRQQTYAPVLEDWIWYTILPLVAYSIVAAAAATLVQYVAIPLFLVAAGALLLLLVGIHNAWDSAVFIAFDEGHTK